MCGHPDIGNGREQAMLIIVRNGAKAIMAGNCNAAAGIAVIRRGVTIAMIIVATVTIIVIMAIAVTTVVATTAVDVKRVSYLLP